MDGLTDMYKNNNQETSKPRTLAESKIIQAFGVPPLNMDEGPINDQLGKY